MPTDPHAAERELVRRCLDGEPSEDAPGAASPWEDFIGRFGPYLKAGLASVCSRRGVPISDADLDDLVSRVWVDLLKDDKRLLRLYRAEASLGTWLMEIAVDRLWPLLRSQAREARRLERFQHEKLGRDLGPDRPHRRAQARESEDQVQGAIRKLPPRERFAVHLFYQAGWTYGRIAQVLEIPLNHVGPLLQAARKRLKDLLKQPPIFLI